MPIYKKNYSNYQKILKNTCTIRHNVVSKVIIKLNKNGPSSSVAVLRGAR